MTSESNDILDVTLTGAAADSAEADSELSRLPRVLRYALLAARGAGNLRERIVAEIAEIAPDLMDQATKWAAHEYDSDRINKLAARLDRLAVVKDDANLRGLADAVRIVSLQYPEDGRQRLEAQRVAKAVLHAHQSIQDHLQGALLAEVERIVIGWASLSLYPDREMISSWASHSARRTGKKLVYGIEREAAERATASKARSAPGPTASATDPTDDHDSDSSAIPSGHLLVCRMDKDMLKNPKLKEVVRGHEHVINKATPLIETPPLHVVRDKLLFEFPYAHAVTDFVLSDLVGRATVGLRPVIIWGPAGSGKTRFCRRLVDLLGVSAWRTDASRSDGAVFAGTDRRWYTAEPCHPFLAISRARHANPIVIIDEIEKAGTRSDYGRFWDCLLGFLDSESAGRYMDPALQITVDLTHVSYIATANSLDPLPSPLRDRFRTIEFPEPRAGDLDALLPAAIADYATDRQMDARWIAPLAAWEHDLIARKWHGGSVRRLRRFVEAILRARERSAQMH
jgi:ATP-dependent Lon protease